MRLIHAGRPVFCVHLLWCWIAGSRNATGVIAGFRQPAMAGTRKRTGKPAACGEEIMRHFNKPTAKLRLLAGCAPAGLVLAAALGGMAAAQDSAETSTNDVITVTGYRQSLAAALDVKRDSSGVVDAIVAEDIAAFPDLNHSSAPSIPAFLVEL